MQLAAHKSPAQATIVRLYAIPHAEIKGNPIAPVMFLHGTTVVTSPAWTITIDMIRSTSGVVVMMCLMMIQAMTRMYLTLLFAQAFLAKPDYSLFHHIYTVAKGSLICVVLHRRNANLILSVHQLPPAHRHLHQQLFSTFGDLLDECPDQFCRT